MISSLGGIIGGHIASELMDYLVFTLGCCFSSLEKYYLDSDCIDKGGQPFPLPHQTRFISDRLVFRQCRPNSLLIIGQYCTTQIRKQGLFHELKNASWCVVSSPAIPILPPITTNENMGP